MEGIIYKIQPYQESSRLLFAYTPHGKVTLLARGAQKLTQKTRVIGQFLTKVSFDETMHKTFMHFKNPKLLNDYQYIKEDYQQTRYAALMLEVIDKFMIDIENHEKIYHELTDALDQKHIQIAAYSFVLKVLQILGYGIHLKADGRVVKGVSIEKGGLVYKNETYASDLDTKEAITLLKLYVLPYNELNDIDDQSLKRIESFISKYYAYHLHTTLKNIS